MSRNGSGTHSLPLPNVATDEIIEAAWANTTLADLSTEITDSLSRSGKGNMSAALKVIAGTVSAPGLSFVDEANSGLYRAGAADIRMALSGVEFARMTSAGLRLASTGLVLGTAGQGVSFAANTGTAATDATTTSEVLSWFEVGTWTPVLWDASASSSEGQTYAKQEGKFLRIGPVVFISGQLQMTSLGTLDPNITARIGGIPFTGSATGDVNGGITVTAYANTGLTAAGQLNGYVAASGTYIFMRKSTTVDESDAVDISEISADGELFFHGFYFV